MGNIVSKEKKSDKQSRFADAMKKHDLILFMAITFIISWFPWYAGLGNEVMTMGPSLAALLVTVIIYGRKGLKDLIVPFLRVRNRFTFFWIALLGPGIIYVAAIGVHRIAGGELPPFIMILEEWKLLPLYLLFVVLMPWNGPIGEEIGWRGFALSRLQNKIGALRASLFIGIIWGVWHLPTFFHSMGVTGVLAGHYGILLFLLIYTLGTVSNSIFMTWLYNKSRGSALIAGVVWHAFTNFWAPVLLSDSSLTAAQEGTHLPTIAPDLYLVVIIALCAGAAIIAILTRGRLGLAPSNESC